MIDDSHSTGIHFSNITNNYCGSFIRNLESPKLSFNAIRLCPVICRDVEKIPAVRYGEGLV